MIVAVTAFVAASILTRAFPFGTVTQTDPSPGITPIWSEQQAVVGPTEIVATTWFVAGSMRETLGPLVAPPWLVTQTAPGDAAIPSGSCPTGIIAVTLLVFGSTRATTLSVRIDTHTAPLPAATCPQVSGAGGQELVGLSLILAVMAFALVPVLPLAAQAPP
jgi:hypothetical protein